MTSGKYCSIDRVIENIYRNYGLTSELGWQDVVEWSGEAMDKIGASLSYIEKVCCVDITDYIGMIPCDMVQLIAVREKTTKTPLLYASGLFHISDKSGTTIKSTCGTGNCSTVSPNTVPSTDPDDNKHCNPFFQFNPSPTTDGVVSNLSNADTMTYKLNNNYIFTGFKSGCIELSYMAVPLDENGLPMVPDDVRYIDAIVSYVAYLYYRKQFITGKVTRDVLEMVEQDWYWKVGNARCHAEYPNVDRMESIKNMWCRLIPSVNEHDSAFKYTNIKEQKRIK